MLFCSFVYCNPLCTRYHSCSFPLQHTDWIKELLCLCQSIISQGPGLYTYCKLLLLNLCIWLMKSNSYPHSDKLDCHNSFRPTVHSPRKFNKDVKTCKDEPTRKSQRCTYINAQPQIWTRFCVCITFVKGSWTTYTFHINLSWEGHYKNTKMITTTSCHYWKIYLSYLLNICRLKYFVTNIFNPCLESRKSSLLLKNNRFKKLFLLLWKVCMIMSYV